MKGAVTSIHLTEPNQKDLDAHYEICGHELRMSQ